MMVIDHENDLLLRSLCTRKPFNLSSKRRRCEMSQKKIFSKNHRYEMEMTMMTTGEDVIMITYFTCCDPCVFNSKSSCQSVRCSLFTVNFFTENLPSIHHQPRSKPDSIYFNIITKQMCVFFKRSVRRLKWT